MRYIQTTVKLTNPKQIMAIARLRQWRTDRIALNNPKTHKISKQTQARAVRGSAIYDARIVRALDFERALAKLPPREIQAMILHCADRESLDSVAAILACSNRTASYLVADATRRLADELERRDLL
jgi:DNA-directed RNA polymerase specialized sigma24 family protein